MKTKQEKQVEYLQALLGTGINLVGRELVKDFQHDPWTNSELPQVNVAQTTITRWGRISQYGNNHTFLVGDTGTMMYWFKVLDQDLVNQKPIQRLMAVLPGRREVPRGSMSCIHWYL